MLQYFIIGASASAVGAVEGIRSIDPMGRITVISEESMAPYSRPSIGEYLDGRINDDSLRFGSADFWKLNDVQILLKRKVVSIDLQSRTLQLDDGESACFDKLLLATGAKPIVPKMLGIEKEGLCTFSNSMDIQKIREKLPETHTSIVIGGGLIGIAAAESLVNLGIQVTVVELRDWMLNILLDRDAAGIVESAMRKRGVIIVTGKSVQEINGKDSDDSKVGSVILSNGERLPCDLVVAAIGVVPRIELAIQAGLKVNRGIIVNRFMETSAPGVYACGDVAEAYDYLKENNQVLALWPLARLGGKVAGLNMAGGNIEYPGGVPMSALRYFDVPLISVGINVQGNVGDYEILSANSEHVYKKIILRREEVVGFTLVGDVKSGGLFNNLMKTRTKISQIKDKLLDPEFSFVNLPEPLRKKTLMEAWL
ncbi:MAG: hypothetical protein QG670_11 [Thermoproteota archaeon]|nr:hypothetical protein [Thermoproteota archaeon]